MSGYFDQYGDAESTLLAAMLYEPDLISKHIDQIHVGLFESSVNKIIAGRTLIQYQTSGCPSVILQLEDIQQQESSPGLVGKLFKRYEDFAGLMNMIYRGEVAYCLERLIDRRKELDFASAYESMITRIEGRRLGADSAMRSMTDLVAKFENTAVNRCMTMADLMETDPADETPETLPTGIQWFDTAMASGAAERGDKIVISAAPGAGKTALALQLTLAMLETNRTSTALWAMGEMTPKQLRNRSLMLLSRLPMDDIRKPYSSLGEAKASRKHAAVDAMRNVLGNRMAFMQSPLTPASIERQITATRASWCVIDYIQLCKSDEATSSRLDELDSIVAALARISQMHKCVMIMISDMPKGAPGRRDIFDAFKGTSEIAYMCDVAFNGLVRADDEKSSSVDVEWHCLKNRHGAQVSLSTTFDRSTQYFCQRGGI